MGEGRVEGGRKNLLLFAGFIVGFGNFNFNSIGIENFIEFFFVETFDFLLVYWLIRRKIGESMPLSAEFV